MVSIRLDGVTPSQNKLVGRHWSVKHALRDEWFWKVKAHGTVACNDLQAHVHITRVSKRLIDPLNVHAGCKGLLDALAEYGYLRGDAAKDITIQVDQRKCEKTEEPNMEIDITYKD